MKALFINPTVKECGVFQFGLNLFGILAHSSRFDWSYQEPPNRESLDALRADVLLYNYQAGIGGWMAGAPFEGLGKQCLIYHDLHVDESKWDAILFADPGLIPHGNWHRTGRPLPAFQPRPTPNSKQLPTIGVHGFLGAWADKVVAKVLAEFEFANVRLLLPFAKYGDTDGAQATAMAARCQAMVSGSGVRLEITHTFLPQAQLLEWLRENDLNCYLRDPGWNWRGVASAPDCALAVRRPVAVNKCNAFRHLHGLSPSICVEDQTLSQIIGNGLSPLVPI